MGLLQKAVETYDAMAHRAEKVFEKETEPLAPVSHITTQANIEITLDQDGNFTSARTVDSKAAKIVIPVTEKSMNRTSKSAAKCPHPLCDRLKYLMPHEKVGYSCFVEQLSAWADSNFTHPKLRPILRYIQGGTILSDLSNVGIIQLTLEGIPQNGKDNAMVCWIVNGLGEESSGPCWLDMGLIHAFIQYYDYQQFNDNKNLCMITGTMEPIPKFYPNRIIIRSKKVQSDPFSMATAKLISVNDKDGYTYRGRFTSPVQAATVGYTASQKAHNALRWLVANQGVNNFFNGRTFLCWNPQGEKVPSMTQSMSRPSGERQRAANPTQYRQQLKEALTGWKMKLPDHAEVVIAAFDAATKGRLAVTYYNELLASDFLERLKTWDESCCWVNGSLGVQSPSLDQLVSWAFGTPRNGKAEIDDRILSQQMQRLVACRVEQAAFPLDIVRALVERASNLQLYAEEIEEISQKTKKKIKKYPRAELLFTACAAIRKYHFDQPKKEEWDMALDKDCTDRSYLFGRLLAIADAIENSTYTDEDRRETNAMRMQKIFSLRPMDTWAVLWDKLLPYRRRLEQSRPKLHHYYQDTIDEINDKLSPHDKTLNNELEGIYLLGFSHQRAYRKDKTDQLKTEEEN